jgi:conjugal transfer mating pair stabilization protein TraN
MFNCCNASAADPDKGGIDQYLQYCREDEGTTAVDVDGGLCHSVGDYCVEKWSIIGCVQRAYVYCCFNSLLGRVIQEQGRLQLQKFSPDGQWGSATAPNCVGFSPDEFQMLDFSQIDFTEFINSLNTTISTDVQQQVTDSVNKFYNSTQ